ncbi:MAG: DegV family protein [Oscillospiraceae bacterium]
MNKIKIMTDSASDIPAELEAEYAIRILPFPVTIGEEGYLERVDFNNKEFYDMLIAAPKIPTTSQITAIQFYEEFKAIQKEGYREVIYTSINSKGSSTYNNALMAKEQLFEKHPELIDEFKIHVVNSATYTIAYGYPVIEAAKKAQKGSSSAEIVAYLEDWFNSVEIYFAPFTLEFVKKSGRVPVAAAFVGELIGLRPIISIINGETKIVEKVRGDKAIIPALLKYAQNAIVPKTPYMIVKGIMEEEAIELFEKSNKQFGYFATDNYYVGASISINAGPKVVGIIVKGRNRNHD